MDFTLSDFKRRQQLLEGHFPTPIVRTAIGRWYELLLDQNISLCSPITFAGLWDELRLRSAQPAGSEEGARGGAGRSPLSRPP
jgi:hypothetical protein